MTTTRHRFRYGWLAMAAEIAALVIRRPRPPREAVPGLTPAT